MRKSRVAIQGIQASFHDQAARTFFGNDIETVECNSFDASCKAVCDNRADYCVIAIENSLAGSILSNYNLIKNNRLEIMGELFLKIELHLLAVPGVTVLDITTIKSHPIAIRQCADYLSANPQLSVVESQDTATCAKTVAAQQPKDTAVIASDVAAEKYGLNIIARNIETHKKNFTRFFVLSKGQQIEEKADKATLCFNLGHEPGSLVKALKVLERNLVNISRIQSVPIVGKPSEYHFYLDVEYIDKYIFDNCLKQLNKKTKQLVVLGEYKRQEFKLKSSKTINN